MPLCDRPRKPRPLTSIHRDHLPPGIGTEVWLTFLQDGGSVLDAISGRGCSVLVSLYDVLLIFDTSLNDDSR